MANELQRPVRILAVDDSAVIRILVSAALEALGFSVEAVDSGHAALEAAKLETFDVVILDVDMPGLDGLAVGRALRSHPRTKDWPIALHTSRAEPGVRSEFGGYDVFLPKPFDARSLGDAVNRLLQKRRPKGAVQHEPVPGRWVSQFS